MSAEQNPYAAPTASDAPAASTKGVGEFAACPSCGGTAAKKVTYTWWGGAVGPSILTHVKCVACQTSYNGKTGKSNRRAIVLYNVVAIVIGLIVGGLFFFV